jgi:hypothetical protein
MKGDEQELNQALKQMMESFDINAQILIYLDGDRLRLTGEISVATLMSIFLKSKLKRR